jgi:hypothetical protein
MRGCDDMGRDIGPLEFFLRARIKFLGGRSIAKVYDRNYNTWFYVFNAAKETEYKWPDGSKTSFTYSKVRYRKPGQLQAGPGEYIVFQGQTKDWDPMKELEPNKQGKTEESTFREGIDFGIRLAKYGDPTLDKKVDMVGKIIKLMIMALLGFALLYIILSMVGVVPPITDMLGGLGNMASPLTPVVPTPPVDANAATLVPVA